MSTPAFDINTASAAEIRALIEGQPIETEPEAAPQPRDEQGRFASTEPEPEVETAPEPTEETEAEPVVVEREIDFEDGSGIQIFRGVGPTEIEAYAALTDELTKAQRSATKKIKELSRKDPPTTPNPAHTAANDFLLAQQLIDNPQETLDKFWKKKLSEYEAEKNAAATAAAQVDQQEKQASADFLTANPDYYVCQENGSLLEEWIAFRRLPRDQAGIQAAYDELNRKGVLTAAPETSPATRPRSSGLSTRSTSTPPPPKPLDTSKLSLDELLQLSGGYLPPKV